MDQTVKNTKYSQVAMSIWRSRFVPDKNKVRLAAKTAQARLIAIDLASEFSFRDPDFDRAEFMKACGF